MPGAGGAAGKGATDGEALGEGDWANLKSADPVAGVVPWAKGKPLGKEVGEQATDQSRGRPSSVFRGEGFYAGTTKEGDTATAGSGRGRACTLGEARVRTGH